MDLKIGDKLRDKRNNGETIYTVTDVFPSHSKYPGMLLEWTVLPPGDGHGRLVRGQAFTTENWQDRWEPLSHS